MALTLTAEGRRLISGAADAVLLGIINPMGQVRLTLGDAVDCPGHKEWIERDAISADAIAGGFSIIVKQGRVAALLPASRLNPRPDGLLEDAIIDELGALLPRATTFDILRY